jgi:hypothetical protein
VRRAMNKGITLVRHANQYPVAKGYVWHAPLMAEAQNDPPLNHDTSISLLRTDCSFRRVDSTQPRANKTGNNAATRNSSKCSEPMADTNSRWRDE